MQGSEQGYRHVQDRYAPGSHVSANSTGATPSTTLVATNFSATRRWSLAWMLVKSAAASVNDCHRATCLCLVKNLRTQPRMHTHAHTTTTLSDLWTRNHCVAMATTYRPASTRDRTAASNADRMLSCQYVDARTE